MHSQTGIVAGLASLAVIAMSAPAAADTEPILPLPAIDLTLDVLPRSPTTTATADEVDVAATATTPATTTPTRTAPATTGPASTQPIKTQRTTAREQALRTHGGGMGSAARQDPSRSLTPRPTPSPKPTVFRVIHEPPAAAGPVDRSAGRPLWLDLISILATAAVAMFAMALMSRRGRPTPPNPSGSALTAQQLVDAAHERWAAEQPNLKVVE